MLWLTIGIIGFGIGLLIEIVPRSRQGTFRPLLWATSFAIILMPMALAALFTERYSSSPWLTTLGWVMLATGATLMAYTLLLELPFGQTFLKESQHPGQHSELIRSGSYALVRHPTVLWYLLMVVGLTLASRSVTLQIAAPVWLAMDIIWIVVQEKVSLPKAFPNYPDYIETTPMLLPTRHSLQACLKSFSLSSRNTPREVVQ